MSDWSELHDDLLIGVVERIEKLEDFIAFGAVCKGWSNVRKKEHFKGLWLRQETPYLMLPIKNENDNIREFYSLVEDEIVACERIPKLKGRKIFESLGWLLAIENDGSMCLLDPFSSVEIPIPHQTTLPDYDTLGNDDYAFVQKMVLSARPSETSDFILMIICGGDSCLAFWSLGNKSWNKIEIQNEAYTDVMYYDGHFYAITYTGCASVYKFEGHPREGRLVTCLLPYNCFNSELFYILKTSESLFIISRDAYYFIDEDSMCYCYTKKFQVYEVVYEVNMSRCIWTEINNLGSMAIFVGHNSTFAVDSSRFSGKIKGNHIYYTDDFWELYRFNAEKIDGIDMGSYDMETRTTDSFNLGLLSKVYPSIWITPSF